LCNSAENHKNFDARIARQVLYAFHWQIETVWGCIVLDSKALTKVQSAALIAIIIVAAVGGSAAYYLLNGKTQATENIKIGVCGDLDMNYGKNAWRGVVLAAEQINAQGGILGRNITIVAEDDDSETPPYDIAVATNALTKLITVDKADYIVSPSAYAQVYQDICAEHQKIYFCGGSLSDNDTQRVLDNYDKYKYFFRPGANASSAVDGDIDCLLTLRNYTGFNKVAYLVEDIPGFYGQGAEVKNLLPDYGFEVVYYNTFTPGTADFTSYFAAIEASGAQILNPMVFSQSCYSLVKEYYDRQSPFVMWGGIWLAQDSRFWKLTDGKCEYTSFTGLPITAGYPLTNKTLQTREAYVQRWGDIPDWTATGFYDVVRFILPDAIKRIGTTETQAVIKTLETTNIETSMARHFIFTSSHDGFVGAAGLNIPSADYLLVCLFQWQNGTQVPVYPKQVMQEAGATYQYPDWTGPWSSKQIP
jgi:branched-chain amino acid transport system substrate-binding protein